MLKYSVLSHFGLQALAMVGQYQFTPFDVGQIKAHMHHGLGPAAIAALMWKADGVSQWSANGVKDPMDKLADDPQYRGERAKGSGPPRKTTRKQNERVVNHVFKERGNRKTTVRTVKRQFPELRLLSNALIFIWPPAKAPY